MLADCLRYVSLGFLICMLASVARTCDFEFTDVPSKTVLSDYVFVARAHRIPSLKNSKEVQVRFKISEILKGQPRGVPGSEGEGAIPAETISVGLFGPKSDDARCTATLPKLGSRYVLFLKSAETETGSQELDPLGSLPSVYRITSLPEPASNEVIALVRKSLNAKYGRKPRVTMKPQTLDATYEPGRQVKMQCMVSGRPKPLVTWYKDDTLLQNSKRITFQDTKRGSNLVIRSLSTSDSGAYRCKATNAVGTTSLKTTRGLQLLVTEKPTTTKPHSVPCTDSDEYCMNGGRCFFIQSLARTFCECQTDYVGDRCEEKRTGIQDAFLVIGKEQARGRRVLSTPYMMLSAAQLRMLSGDPAPGRLP